MGLFTIEFELGRETREMIERVVTQACVVADRVAANASVRVELGEKTRETLATLVSPREEAGKARDALGGIVERARDEARRVTGS